MADHLYEVHIERGTSHLEWEQFYKNVSELNAKSPDYGGINNLCVLKHSQDAATVHFLCTEGMERGDDVIVTEITQRTLEGQHIVLGSLVDRYFRPYGRFPNL